MCLTQILLHVKSLTLNSRNQAVDLKSQSDQKANSSNSKEYQS